MLPWFRIPANITLLSKTCQKLLFVIEFPYNFSSQLTLKISKRKKPIYPNQETYPISRENRIVIRDPSSMWLQRDLAKYLRNITRVKTHRDKIPKFTREYQLVEILPQINLICNILRTGGKTKLFFRWGVILKVGLSLGISLGWIQPRHWDRTAQKMKLSIKDFFSKCDQIRRKLEKFIFVQCRVSKICLFEKIINDWKPLNIFSKSFILNALIRIWICICSWGNPTQKQPFAVVFQNRFESLQLC